ncbi:Organic solvent ABC transporter substrate-binding protein [Thauera humireducens]|uniref:MlaD family protein n=1 Tax=Thauera humireducens TaxID=1134435 RepID=UPI002467A767|nr:MlaD family protein [Thauera humireducens]CAH1748781.1 Organic solvent ABC transporter substrate-binding protein [Thauera humireducens]
MENRAHALAAGLFALLLGTGVLIALWWFSQDRETAKEVVLVAREDINGLGPQARVRFRGLAVGTVKEIRIDPQDSGAILVRVRVAADVPLTRGTRATLGTLGVTGLAYVQLDDRGADPTPLVGENGETPRIPLEPGLLSQIGDRTLAAVEQFRLLSERMSAVFDDDSARRLKQTLARLEAAAEGMDRSFAEAPRTLEAIRSVFTPDNVARLSAALANIEQSSAEATPALQELRMLLVRLDDMADRFDQTATTASNGLLEGTLPRLNELLRDLSATSRRVGRLIEEVESTPQMLLTGRAVREPGPGETGFVEGRK